MFPQNTRSYIINIMIVNIKALSALLYELPYHYLYIFYIHIYRKDVIDFQKLQSFTSQSLHHADRYTTQALIRNFCNDAFQYTNLI